MLKNRLILLGAIVLAVIGLYKLPRVVVDNREGGVDTTQGQSEDGTQDTQPDISKALSAHQTQIPDSTLSKIQNLRVGLQNAENLEKRIIFADSLAKLYGSVGKYDSAAVYYELKVRYNPTAEGLEEAGMAHYNAFRKAMETSSRYFHGEKTREYFNNILKGDPSRLDLKVKVAVTYVSGTNPMQGITMIREVLEEDPDHQEALFQIGLLSVSSGQFDRAVERFEKLIRIDPKNTEAFFYLGYSYLQIGATEKAKEMFQKVVELNTSPEMTEEALNYLQNI